MKRHKSIISVEFFKMFISVFIWPKAHFFSTCHREALPDGENVEGSTSLRINNDWMYLWAPQWHFTTGIQCVLFETGQTVFPPSLTLQLQAWSFFLFAHTVYTMLRGPVVTLPCWLTLGTWVYLCSHGWLIWLHANSSSSSASWLLLFSSEIQVCY